MTTAIGRVVEKGAISIACDVARGFHRADCWKRKAYKAKEWQCLDEVCHEMSPQRVERCA